MRNLVLTYIDRFRHDRSQRLMFGSVLLVLAMMVTLLVYWQLRLSGITMTNETYCGYEEHVHTEECYEYTLICGLEETGHVHDESCYEEQQVLVCTIEESEGHSHCETCYDEEGNLICGLSESTGHTHDESCYETQLVLVCGLEETPDAHIHTDECYEKTLVCELEEHTHTIECMINLNADLEDYTIWEATLPELTGDLRTDVVNIAYSQLGYNESTANYSVGEDETIHYGYTRYGAWYGNSYADWDSMFVAFCLEYAGISDEFTYNAGAYAWSVDLTNLGYYQTADAYAPSIGDVVFIDTDDDGKANTTAIVVAVDETTSTITVIQGNYTVTDPDDNTTDTVALVTYSTVVETEEAESEIVTLSTEPEAEEITPVILGYANISPEADSEEVEEEAEEISDEEAEEDAEETDVSEDDLSILTFTGEDYTITVSYGEDAALPEGTELIAYEYAQDSENYLARYAEAAELYGWEEDEAYNGFRLFNIGLYYDGEEIEPAAEVTVTVTYTDETSANSSVSVTHFTDTSTEPLDATLTDGSVTFTSDGFSEYGIMLTATSTTYTVTIENSIATDGKLTAVITDSSGEIVEYSNEYTYTWYRSKEPYLTHLTDSVAYLEDAPSLKTTANRDNYVAFSGTMEENTCTVADYPFYYFYVAVTINGTTYYSYNSGEGFTYVSVDGAAEFVEISKDGNELTATLYVVDDNGAKTKVEANDNFTYTYTWYKSQNYDASSDAKASDAPDANTLTAENTYKSYKVVTGEVNSTLELSSSDSFYFYYVVVTLNYRPSTYESSTDPYVAYAKGYEDWEYAGYVGSTYTAAIVDNISAKGTFEAVLYNSDGEVVDTSSGYTFTWYKSDDEYLISSDIKNSSMVYSDLTNVPSSGYSEVTDEYVLDSNTINIVENSGALCYYYVVITDSQGKGYTSVAKYVQYSDQIENGGFENGYASTQTDQNRVPYWTTTNEEYSDNHGTYKGYRPIEVGIYGSSNSLSATVYAFANSYGGESTGNNQFVELNATSASTLYQSVLTTPKTTLSWSVYHQNRTYADNVSTEPSGTYKVDDTKEVTLDDGTKGTLTTYESSGTDSMYVIIMSDADAKLLLADVDENNESYDEQQEVIDAVATAILSDNTADITNGNASASNGTNSGCYEGTYTLRDGTTVDVTLWKVTTTKTVTRVVLTDSNGDMIDASSLAADYPTSEGWASWPNTSATYGYYKVTEWVKYSGSYTVPEGQYLTRFFFAAASTQNGNSTAGNFIDTVEFSTDLSYTIDYYIWDVSEGKYVRQSDTYIEKGTVAYDATDKTVQAKNLSTFTGLGYTQVGSVTSTVTGGTNPTFDSEKTSSLTVTTNTTYLSIYLASSNLALKKVNANTGDVLENVEFVMYKVDGNDKYYYESYDSTNGITWSDANEIAYLNTDKDGMIDFGSLSDGTYYIEETKPLDGYNTVTGTITVVVEDGAVKSIEFVDGDSSLLSYALDGNTTVITLKNNPGVELPNTGGVCLPIIYLVGSGMIIISATTLIVRRKRKI